jgi:N-acetylmuramoyl-L-alanine amidase
VCPAAKMPPVLAAAFAVAFFFGAAGCQAPPPAPAPAPPPPAPAPVVHVPAARGDEIIVAGQRFPTGTRIVTWLEPGGYNGYLNAAPSTPRTGLAGPPPQSGLAAVQRVVDQFVLHYDGCGLSRICFTTLQERRLSVHFLLDVDGMIYQTLDLRERAAHATIANDRSIGIEIANLGAYPEKEKGALEEWYQHDTSGRTVMKVPAHVRETGIRTPGFVARPIRPGLVRGSIQGQPLVQYDFTPEQYAALAKLTATLGRVFPEMTVDYPHGRDGRLIPQALSAGKLSQYRGVLGHFHVQANKMDPGPAFQWQRLFDEIEREGK